VRKWTRAEGVMVSRTGWVDITAGKVTDLSELIAMKAMGVKEKVMNAMLALNFSHRSRRVEKQIKSRNKTGGACIDCDSDKSGSEAGYQSVHRKSGTRAVKSTHRKHKHKRDSESSRDSRRVLPTLKLGSYDGTSCLETFLAKFRNISEYYSWSERD